MLTVDYSAPHAYLMSRVVLWLFTALGGLTMAFLCNGTFRLPRHKWLGLLLMWLVLPLTTLHAHVFGPNLIGAGWRSWLACAALLFGFMLGLFVYLAEEPGPQRFLAWWRGEKPSDRYADLRREIDAFADLVRGENPYDADAIEEKVIRLALRFVALLQKHEIRVDWLVPGPDGSIMANVFAPQGPQEWEFQKSEKVLVYYQNPVGGTSTIELALADWEPFLLTRRKAATVPA